MLHARNSEVADLRIVKRLTHTLPLFEMKLIDLV